jgi:hypothetical protein
VKESVSHGAAAIFPVQAVNGRHQPLLSLITLIRPEAFCDPIDKVVRVSSEMALGELS